MPTNKNNNRLSSIAHLTPLKENDTKNRTDQDQGHQKANIGQ